MAWISGAASVLRHAVLGHLWPLLPVIVTSIGVWLHGELRTATTAYIGGNKPNWPKSDVISQNAQEWVTLPFLT